jgi:hypothetical protein
MSPTPYLTQDLLHCGTNIPYRLLLLDDLSDHATWSRYAGAVLTAGGCANYRMRW